MQKIPMHQGPFDSPSDLATVIQSAALGSSEAQDIINNNMAQDPQRLTQSFLYLIDTEDQNMKQLAAQIFAITLSHASTSNQISNETEKYIADGLIKCIYSSVIGNVHKNLLKIDLMMIFKRNEDRESQEKYIALAKEKFTTEDPNRSSFYLLEAILRAYGASTEVAIDIVKFFLQNLVEKGQISIKCFSNEANNDAPNEERLKRLVLNSQSVNEWTTLFCKFMDFLGETDFRQNPQWETFIKMIINDEVLAHLLHSVIALQPPTLNETKHSLFSSYSGIKEIKEPLYQSKISVLKSIKSMFRSIKDPATASDPILLDPSFNKIFAVFLNRTLEFIIESLLEVFRDFPACQNRLKDDIFRTLIRECFEFITIMTSFRQANNLLYHKNGDIVMNICLPLIASTPEELKLFEENPEAFLELTDLERPTPSLKLAAIQLIMDLCTHVNGALTLISTLLIKSVEHCLGKSDTLFLIKNQDSSFLSVVETRSRLESCILMLGYLRDHIILRRDIMKIIEEFLLRNTDFFVSQQEDTLLQVRILDLLKYHLDYLFSQMTLESLPFFCFINQCAISDKKVVSDIACGMIITFITDSDNFRLKLSQSNNLHTLIPKLKDTKNYLLIDAVHSILDAYRDENWSNSADQIIRNCVERIFSEYSEVLKNPKEPKIILSKTWNLMRTVVELEGVEAFLEEIEDIVSPLFCKVLEDNLPWRQDILFFMLDLLNQTHRISPLVLKVFDSCPRMLEESGYVLSSVMCDFLRLVVLLGQEDMWKDKTILERLVDTGIKSLKPTSKNADSYDISNAVFLLHTIMENYAISQGSNILEACLNKFHEENLSGIAKARIAGLHLMLVAALYTNLDITLEEWFLKPILDFVIEQPILFGHNHSDRKLLVLSLIPLVKTEQFHPLIKDYLPMIFDILVSYLGFIEQMEQKEWIKNRRNSGEESEEEENINKEKNMPDDSKDIDILRNLLEEDAFGLPKEKPKNNKEKEIMETEINTDGFPRCPILIQEDEFEFFTDVIAELKGNNPALLKMLVKGLSPRKRKLLRDIMTIERISGISMDSTGVLRRIIRTKCRK